MTAKNHFVRKKPSKEELIAGLSAPFKEKNAVTIALVVIFLVIALLFVFYITYFFFSVFSWIFIFVGLAAFFHGFSSMKKHQMIANTPTSKIRSIAMGLVEVFGKVTSSEKFLLAPVSGKKCVYYQLNVDAFDSTKRKNKWSTILNKTEQTPFFLSDETGKVLVDPVGSQVSVDNSFSLTFAGNERDKIPKRLLDVLSENKIELSEKKDILGFPLILRFTENILLCDKQAYVLGTAADNPFVKSSAKNEENIIIQKGTNESTYFISDKSEKELLSDLGWLVKLELYGGALIIILSIYFIGVMLAEIGVI